jgi:hypothetical protein
MKKSKRYWQILRRIGLLIPGNCRGGEKEEVQMKIPERIKQEGILEYAERLSGLYARTCGRERFWERRTGCYINISEFWKTKLLLMGE